MDAGALSERGGGRHRSLGSSGSVLLSLHPAALRSLVLLEGALLLCRRDSECKAGNRWGQGLFRFTGDLELSRVLVFVG